MRPDAHSRKFWILCVASIIALGILSRLLQTGWAILDKYLGDALYAAMIYAILRVFSSAKTVIIWSAAIMIALETFQLTLIPLHLLASDHLFVRICARLLGTEFSWLDLLSYAVGLGCIYRFDRATRAGE